MNVMLASSGYPCTVVPLDRSGAYMAALEEARMRHTMAPFAQLRGQLVEEGAARQAGGKSAKSEQLTDTRHVPAMLDSDDASVYAGSDRRSPVSLPGPDRGQ